MGPEVQRTMERPRRLGRFVLLSVLGHLAVVAGIAFVLSLQVVQHRPPPGEPLIVDLAADQGGPVGITQRPEPTPPPAVASAPKPEPAPRPAPRVAPAPPPRIAVAPPASAPVERREPTRAPEPPKAPEIAEGAPEPPKPAPVASGPEPPPQAPTPATAQAPSSDGGPAGPRVASIPREPGVESRPAPDLRALRGSGAGPSLKAGRGGIAGDAIRLDSPDPRFSEYLESLRRMIQAKFGVTYPCVKDPDTRECRYYSAQLYVEFGILKDGTLQFIDVKKSSGLVVYDDYATTAIKLASPFPQPPKAMLEVMKAGSTGVAILGQFTYHAEVSLRTLLR